MLANDCFTSCMANLLPVIMHVFCLIFFTIHLFTTVKAPTERSAATPVCLRKTVYLCKKVVRDQSCMLQVSPELLDPTINKLKTKMVRGSYLLFSPIVHINQFRQSPINRDLCQKEFVYIVPL